MLDQNFININTVEIHGCPLSIRTSILKVTGLQNHTVQIFLGAILVLHQF